MQLHKRLCTESCGCVNSSCFNMWNVNFDDKEEQNENAHNYEDEENN